MNVVNNKNKKGSVPTKNLYTPTKHTQRCRGFRVKSSTKCKKSLKEHGRCVRGIKCEIEGHQLHLQLQLFFRVDIKVYGGLWRQRYDPIQRYVLLVIPLNKNALWRCMQSLTTRATTQWPGMAFVSFLTSIDQLLSKCPAKTTPIFPVTMSKPHPD